MPAEDEEAAVLDSVLEALANRHRREIVYVLGLQPCAISQLARMRGLSLPAIHKHIKILENAGLVSRPDDLPDPEPATPPAASGLGGPVPHLLGQRPGVLRELPQLPR